MHQSLITIFALLMTSYMPQWVQVKRHALGTTPEPLSLIQQNAAMHRENWEIKGVLVKDAQIGYSDDRIMTEYME
jgi:hypothetical protein